MKSEKLGFASKELFTQFLVRIAKEIPNATIAVFSTLKYVNAQNFEEFREWWNAKYLGGFVIHSQSFDGLKGDFPIGFLIWETHQTSTKKSTIDSVTVDVLDKKGKPVGEKTFYNLSKKVFLSAWMHKLKTNNQPALPLSNAVTVSTNPRLKMSADGAKGFLFAGNNDFQNVGTGTLVTSSIYTGRNGGGAYVDESNLWQAAITFSVRLLIKHTWLNHNDQFLQPNQPTSEEFQTDCLIWMLFHGKNLTASANGLHWKDQNWSLVNHFIPFTEAELGAPDPFESDFMVQYMAGKTFGPEARAVMEEGQKLWQAYFAHTDSRGVRDELKLNRPDVGWYQVRKALDIRNASGDFPPVSFQAFQQAYKALSEKLQPMVYELGFLKA